jgi:hypothetical protein
MLHICTLPNADGQCVVEHTAYATRPRRLAQQTPLNGCASRAPTDRGQVAARRDDTRRSSRPRWGWAACMALYDVMFFRPPLTRFASSKIVWPFVRKAQRTESSSTPAAACQSGHGSSRCSQPEVPHNIWITGFRSFVLFTLEQHKRETRARSFAVRWLFMMLQYAVDRV